jgi:nucleoside-diphosphate-sugar epimerase
VITPSLSMVPKWSLWAQQEGLAVIIVNPGIIIGPGFPEQGSGQLFKQIENGLAFLP